VVQKAAYDYEKKNFNSQFQFLYLSSRNVVGVLFFARCWIEHNIVDGLDELQVNHALNKQTLKDLVLHVGGHPRSRYLRLDGLVTVTTSAVHTVRAVRSTSST
jgi:hypothetical protein